jgi:uncharacterized membrane protein
VTIPEPFTGVDIAALAWFLACWVGYSIAADHTRLNRKTVAAVMSEYRVHWMMAMMQRDLRMIDTSIISGILHGVAFFASTAILLVGGLIAGLGAGPEAIEVLSHLPYSATTSLASWEMKLLLLIGIFVYAFFKLAWAFRLFVNCSILIGAAPIPPCAPATVEIYSTSAGHALSLASSHYNAGLRGYFFALAAIWWFYNPYAFLVATSLVLLVMCRREFHSRTLRTINAALGHAATTRSDADVAPEESPESALSPKI